MVVLHQLLLVSPLLCWIWIIGGVRLLREPRLRFARAVPVAYLLLLAAIVVAGGKPYYAFAFMPVLVAAGAAAVVTWVSRRSPRLRAGLVASAVGLGLLIDAVLFLPLLPPHLVPDTPVLAINYDAGETIGWPAVTSQVAEVVATLPPGTPVITSNYGEYGALVRYHPGIEVHSGHNSLYDFGPPRADAEVVLLVGLDPEQVTGRFARCEQVGTLDNRVVSPTGNRVDNDEQGEPLVVCHGPLRPWIDLWPSFRRYG